MSKVEYGSHTIVSTGNKTILLNDSSIQIEHLVIFVASSSTQTSAGYSDGTTTFTGSSAYGDENDNYTITHYRNISGTKTKVFEGVITNISVTGMFTLNVSTCTQATKVYFVAQGV